MNQNQTLSLEEIADTLKAGERLIGLDLGTKTIGVALSDVSRTVATSVETIKRKKFSQDVMPILDLIETETIGGIILGLPMNMDGSEGPRVQSTKAFARNLQDKTDVPVAFWDERLSTAAVERTLIEADTSRKRRSEVIDKVAAAYILQGALDRMNSL